MASTLGTEIPVRITQSTTESIQEKGESKTAKTCKYKKIATLKHGRATKPSISPLTGAEVVQILVQKRDLGEYEIYYLKTVDGDAYRPYDLRVVHPSEAGPEHYVFTSKTVLHVTQTGIGGTVSLAEWYRQYVLWTDLQKIAFFRDFRLQKAFFWWHQNTRKRIFQRRRKNLEDMLLIAVPQFRNALHLLKGVIEELKETHWMPLDVCECHTLTEFKNILISKNQECLQILEKLSQYHTLTLNMVKEDSYKKHQELQLHLKLANDPKSFQQPIHLLMAHQRKLKKELAQSESTLKKLGNFAALVHQMIVQSLVTVILEDAISFLDLLKSKELPKRSLFHTELRFSADNQLTVEPPIHLFKEAVSQALLTVGDSIIQKCDDCGFFLEVSKDVLISAQDLDHDFSCINPSVNTVDKNTDGNTSQILRDMSACWQTLPKVAFPVVQGNMVHGCYSPLSKSQLEWHISINDITKEVEKEQSEIMQEAELEIQQLYESYAWMVQIHLFTCQWSRASLESMRGRPASVYEENIRKVRNWAERISAADSSFSSSNQLFVIHCTHTKEALGQRLRFIEEEVQEQLVEQIRKESESLISYLEGATAELKTAPQDLRDFSKYALRVREFVKVLPDKQKHLEYIQSLQNTICMNYRNMTEAELTVEEKMLNLWNCFIPLLKEADDLVCRHHPSMAKAVDMMFSFLFCDLKNIVSDSTSGPFLDPCQNAKEMMSKLNYMCMHVNTLSAKLDLLSRSSQQMGEHTIDLTVLTTDVQKVIARKDLWELIAVYTTWLEEWKPMVFSEVVVSEAQDKITEWKEQAQSLTTTIPASDAVLQEILGSLENISHQLLVLAKLQSPTLKGKHWRAILEDLGLKYKSEKNVTVADLMSQQLESHQNLIDKICRCAQRECDMKQTFQKLCHRWEGKLFQLDVFAPLCVETRCKHTGKTTEGALLNVLTDRKHPSDPRFTIDLGVHFAEIETSLMMLSTMLKSPYSVEFRLPLEDWIQTLQELEKLLALLERYQQMWAFLTNVLGGTFFRTQRMDLLKHFQPVDETFEEMMASISNEPRVLNLVSTETNDRFRGDSLCQVLLNGLSAMEVISKQMSDLLDDLCEECPRFWFLSEGEVMQILSLDPTPFEFQPFVQKSFKGVHLLEVDCEIQRDGDSISECQRQMKVLGIFGSFQEHVAFQSPLEPNADALKWFCNFDKKLKLTMVQLLTQCAVVRKQLEPSSQNLASDTNARDNQLPSAVAVLGLLSEYPLECLLVVEKAMWCSVALQAFQESSSVKFSTIKAHIAAKLKDLSHYIRDGVTGSKTGTQVSKYTMMCLRALLQLTMNHAEQLHRLMDVPCARESSFEWLSCMKYYINSEDYNDPACFVDILGHQVQYSFEYSGPGEWEMVHTPCTDRAILGILIALTTYRCCSVGGPSMSGKKNTVIQLGKALGRQVVLKQCYPSMMPRVIQRMLVGALQAGAWLVLNSVDLLTHSDLSILGQHLVEIHQSFNMLRRDKKERLNCETEMKISDGVAGFTNAAESECHMTLAGKHISASLSYGYLFSSTLHLLGQRSLTSAIHTERKSCKAPTHGLQEVMSFVRILHALLQHFGKEVEKPESVAHIDTTDMPPAATGAQSKQEQLSRNIFLLAYIWGFGGRLHSRHWPQFDLLARQVLLTCRYKIVVPDEVSVYEHFFSIDTKMCPTNTLSTGSVIPMYRKYTYLLNLMLEAKQPVLVSGEPGSGKTTLCQTVLTFDKPHINLPASPLLSSRDLHTILKSIRCQKNCKETTGFMANQPRLFLFVDDLHEAPCDVFGTSAMALETLRQSISKGEILTFDTYSSELLQSGTISYLAACCISGLDHSHSGVISPRLSRLFSIFVLDGVSPDILMSIYSPWLKIWLSEMPLNRHIGEDMSSSIVTATNELYHAVSDRFQPSVQRPHFIFSHRDLQKVFQGMYLWRSVISNKENKEVSQPGFPPASVLNIVQVWMHECMRTFSDRLCSEDDRKTVVSLIAKTAATHYGMKLANEIDGDSQPAGENTDPVDLPKDLNQQSQLHSALTKPENIFQQPQILQYLEDTMAQLAFGPDLSEALKSIKQYFKFSPSYQEQDLDTLVQKLCVLTDGKEEGEGPDCSITTKYILHRQRVSQLLHIIRALLLPRGHGVLIGSDRGTGRKTTVCLAAHLTGYELLEIHAGNQNNLHEILKEARNKTRSDGISVIILVHEEISQSVREELLVLMAHGACPALFTDEELRDLVSRMTAAKYSRRYLMDNWMFEKRLSQVHRNIHIFLLMPYSMSESTDIPSKNEAQSWVGQMAKALRHSCCVEVYQPWSNQSLVEVAVQCLKTSPLVRGSSEASLSVAMAGIHRSAFQYASVLLRNQPFSPQTYMEFIAHFGYLCSLLHKQCQDKANRIAAAVSRLDAVNNISMQRKEHLISVQKMVSETDQREKELLQAVEDHKKLFEEACEKCAAEDQQLCYLEEQINQAQKQIKPAFLSGLQILKCLDPSDVEEVRHYRDPPVGVVQVMDAICLLFSHPPGWESAKQLLSQADFFQELEYFDRYNLTNEQLQQLGQIVHSPQFVPEAVREVSKACESLCRWVQAVYEYCCVQQRVLLKQQLEVQAAETRSRLNRAEQRKQEVYSSLEATELHLQCVQNDLMEQLMLLHKAESAEQEASACAGQSETYGKVWRAVAQDTEVRNQNVPGDALLLAATVSYLGPFGPDTRTELLRKWQTLCQTGSIDINPNDPRTSLFTQLDTVPGSLSPGFPIPVTERLQLPLGQALGMNEWQTEDTLSARLMVKLLLCGYRSTYIQHWPLLVDSQQHLEMNFPNSLIPGKNTKLEEEIDFGMVICGDDVELVHKLDQAAERGLRVLVTHVERAIPNLQFLAKLSRPAGCYFPGLNQPIQMVHPEFCLFLSTCLPIRLLNSGIHPSILAQVRVVDLSLSSEDIPELMLTQLLQAECKELLIQHLQFQNYKQELREKLATEEDALMGYILQSNTVLLQDPDFLPRVKVCQEVTKKLQDEMKQLREQLEHHESLLAVPRHFVRLGAALYQTLQAVSSLSPAYYFSLHGFMTVMQEAFTGEDRIIGKVPGSIIQELINTMVVKVLVQYRPCLFKTHAAVLKLLVSLALLQHNQLCSEGERLAFLIGLGDTQHPGTDSPSSIADLPSWISPLIHSELLRLEKIPSFRGLIASLCASPKQWQEYLHFPSSTVLGPVPCRSHCHLSLLQRALLWKTMIPDCLEGLADAINACQLCLPQKKTETEAPLVGNPEACSLYLVKHKEPIILTLPNPNRDMQISIEPLCLINQLAKCVPGKKEIQVKVLSFWALCDRNLFLSMLDKAANDGHWLVFNNSHLFEQLDDDVVAKLSHLISSVKEKPCLIHPSFRLWFITQENTSHLIPASVRMCALHLVCDSSWDLKEELSCSLRQVASISQPQLGIMADNKSLLRCAIFHSVLVQRQTYKYLGQGRIYHWSQEDLHALVDAYIHVAHLCHDKTKVLQYLAVSLVYGGHVTDSADLEVLEDIAKTCFTTASRHLNSGPHILSKLVRSSGHSDLSGQLQVVEQGLWESANISEPVVLGFNADITTEIIKITSYNMTMLLRTSQTPLRSVRRFSTKEKQLATLPAFSDARVRLEGLKRYLTSKNESAGALPRGPVRDFLQAEWDDLIDSVSLLLSQLQQPVQYSLTFASLLKLTDLSGLERRAELLSAYLWHHDASDPPGAYRLSAFKNARGLLVAMMREAAQVYRKYITDIILQFQVLSYSTYPISLPLDSVYLCGLELKGASWDTQLQVLQDTVSPQSCSVPLLCVKAQVRSTNSSHDTAPCKSSYLMDNRNVHCAAVVSLTTPQVPIYHCPLYLDEGLESGSSGLADVNIITKVPLHTNLDPLLCSLRRVRLVSRL
uniref:dynein heavy chain domain-containing protein 1 n=1 Tax=Maylandia zebra TaxID=106582 RepID=UPI000647C83B|nr:dynein heavy chain domain-containing protein 1 [Maylandia zebra]